MGLVPFVAALESVGTHSSSLAAAWIAQVQGALALETAGSALAGDAVGGAQRVAFVGPEHGLTLANGRVQGVARVVPLGLEAGQFVVAATDNGAPVLAVVAAAGVDRKAIHGLGLASAACAMVQFGAPATVVATGTVAQAAIRKAQIAGWIGVAATACGGGSGALAVARQHAAERIAFGKPLLVQEAVLRKLVECKRGIDAARQLAWHAARLHDLGQDATEAAIGARLAAIDAMVAAGDEGIQILGGFGYTVEYHVERHYRDGKVFDVLDGGGEGLRHKLAALQFA
jgi:alkylation response protein AidB-like acyl-CoA dehydrogenase